MSAGRQDYDQNLVSYDDSKKVLTLKNLLPEAYRYSMRALHPVVFPVQVVILYMIQCNEYVLSPEFISTFRKLDACQADVLWSMFFEPKNCTLEMIRTLLFNPCTWDSRVSLRYFIPGYNPATASTPVAAANLNEPAYLRMQKIIDDTNLDLLSKRAQELHGEFVQLPDDISESTPRVSFVVDKEGYHETTAMLCPMDVDEALCMVRRFRDGRMNMIGAMYNDLAVNMNEDVEDVVFEDGFMKII